MIARLLDLLAFAYWDLGWSFQPLSIRLAMRLEPAWPPGFRVRYYRNVLGSQTTRSWRYVQSRRPDIARLWDEVAVAPGVE